MQESTIERLALLEEAAALEKVGGDWKLRHVLAVLGCHRASLYRNAWLMKNKIAQPGGPAWKPATVRRFQELNKGSARPRQAS